MELNASGTVLANDSFGPFGLIRSPSSYGSGASSFGRTGVAGNSHYYAYDPQGTPFLVLNDGSSPGTSSVLTTYEADAFGNQAAGNTAVTPASDPYVGFGGEWGYRTDAATGLELLEHRYYDPATGRFVTRDPVGYEGGMDLYAYCNNQSIDHEDSSGFSGGIKVPGMGIRIQMHPNDTDTRGPEDGHYHGNDGNVYDREGNKLDPKDGYRPSGERVPKRWRDNFKKSCEKEYEKVQERLRAAEEQAEQAAEEAEQIMEEGEQEIEPIMEEGEQIFEPFL